MTDPGFARELSALSAEAFPETPSLVGGVLSSIAARSERTRRRIVGAAIAAVLVVAVLLVPAPREAVARFFGIGGVTIERVAEYDLPPAATTDAPLGERVELDDVVGAIGFTPSLPDIEGLAEPEVYVRTDIAGGLVSLVYRSGSAGPGLVITEFETVGEVAIKQLGPGVTFREVDLAPDVRGFWIEGGAHTIAFFDADGSLLEDSARLVGNTLVWQAGDLTIRIESGLSLTQVLEIARSMVTPAS